MNVEKSHKSAHVWLFFSNPERTSWSLTPQLDTVIIEVSSVKGLIRPERLYTETIQGQTFAINGYGDTEFSTAANLNYDQKCSPLTNVFHDLKLLSLVQD